MEGHATNICKHTQMHAQNKTLRRELEGGGGEASEGARSSGVGSGGEGGGGDGGNGESVDVVGLSSRDHRLEPTL